MQLSGYKTPEGTEPQRLLPAGGFTMSWASPSTAWAQREKNTYLPGQKRNPTCPEHPSQQSLAGFVPPAPKGALALLPHARGELQPRTDQSLPTKLCTGRGRGRKLSPC